MENNLYDKSLLSNTITFLRFPLIVGVVFIHTNFLNINIKGKHIVSEGEFPLHDILRYLISEELARVAVPLFFFISGYLFFYKPFSFEQYISNIRKRVNTLLIPYLFWNIVVLILLFLTQIFLSSYTSGFNKLIIDYTFSDWLGIFWNHSEGAPICYQFWFIRDLMIIVLFSPLVYYYIRTFNIIGIIVLGILWALGLHLPITGFSGAALFFFSFGAYYSINNHNFVSDFRSLQIPFIFLYIFIVITDTILWNYQVEGFSFIHNLGILVGLITIVACTAYGLEIKKLKCSVLLTNSSFFIYAFHGMPIAFCRKLWVKYIDPITEFTLISGYILIPFIIIILGIGIYISLLKLCPRFISFITGGR